MKYRSILALSIVLGCIVTLLPILASVYVAGEDAERREQKQLQEFTNNAVVRLEVVTGQALDTIAAMERTGDQHCTSDELARLREFVFANRYVQDAGLYGDGIYRCSALLGDVERRRLPLPPPDWHAPEGYEVWFELDSALGGARKDVVVGRSGYYVSTDPSSYVDVVTRAQRVMAAVNTDVGRVVGATPGADRAGMLAAWRAGGQVSADDGWLYATARSRRYPLAIVIKTPRQPLVTNWRMLLTVWLLGGIGVGVGLGWMVLRLLSRQLSLPSALQRAVRRGELEVRYQPVVALGTGRCVGAEALVRWRKGVEFIPPDVFIPLAEQHGLIQAITDQVLDKIIGQLQPLLQRQPGFYVSVNVSRDDLEGDRFLGVLRARLARTAILPAQIVIEITERSFVAVEAARKTIEAFRAAGHPVYIDDFGTGYSSLSYLESFTVDALKIDKSFVDTVGQGAASSVVAPHIIAMAQALGMGVVAEGVEQEAQAAYLRDHGVLYGQGWLYARPMSARDLLALLDRERRQSTPPGQHGGHAEHDRGQAPAAGEAVDDQTQTSTTTSTTTRTNQAD